MTKDDHLRTMQSDQRFSRKFEVKNNKENKINEKTDRIQKDKYSE